MSNWLIAELRSQETRHLALTFAGYAGRFALSFIASVIIARWLGPIGYGLIALVSVVLNLADTLGDFGLTYSAVRAISRQLGTEPDRARQLAHGYFSLALIANSIAALAGFVLAEPIARDLLGRPEAEPYLQIALLGLISVAGSGFAMALLQATRRFKELAALQIASALIYLIVIVALAATGKLNVFAVVLLGVLNPLLSFFIGRQFFPPHWISLRATFALSARRAWGELVAFGKWLWVSAIFSLLASQLDLLLLSHWASAAVVGIYALAFNLATKLDIVNQTRMTVLLPTVSALDTRQQMNHYIRQSLALSIVGTTVFALLVPFFAPFIMTFYGAAYAEAVNALIVLTAVVIFDLVTSPLILLGFPLNQPRALAASDVVRVLTLLAVGWLLIPLWGPIGAALARLASRMSGAVFMLTLVGLRIRNTNDSPLPSTMGD